MASKENKMEKKVEAIKNKIVAIDLKIQKYKRELSELEEKKKEYESELKMLEALSIKGLMEEQQISFEDLKQFLSEKRKERGE